MSSRRRSSEDSLDEYVDSIIRRGQERARRGYYSKPPSPSHPEDWAEHICRVMFGPRPPVSDLRPPGGVAMTAADPTTTGEPPRKKVERAFNASFRVLVGPNECEFHVHKAILCHHSSFFNAALRNDWLESEQQLTKLPEDEPEVFETFLSWVYTGKFDGYTVDDRVGCNNDSTQDADKSNKANPTKDLDFVLIAKVYFFADKVQSRACKIAALQYLKASQQRIKSIDAGIWDIITFRGGEDDECSIELCKLLRRWFIYRAPESNFTADHFEKAPDLMQSVIETLCEKARPAMRFDQQYAEEFF